MTKILPLYLPIIKGSMAIASVAASLILAVLKTCLNRAT